MVRVLLELLSGDDAGDRDRSGVTKKKQVVI